MGTWTTEKVRIWQAAIKSTGMPPAQDALDSLIQGYVDMLLELENKDKDRTMLRSVLRRTEDDLEASKLQNHAYRDVLEWIAGQSDLFFAECVQAEEIVRRCKEALGRCSGHGLYDCKMCQSMRGFSGKRDEVLNDTRCPKCGASITQDRCTENKVCTCDETKLHGGESAKCPYCKRVERAVKEAATRMEAERERRVP